MAIQYPKWNHAILPSRDEIHIFRDPPASIHTRKKERVEVGDTLYNLRDDETRLQENIRVYARGVNPSVAVNYSNLSTYATSSSTNLTQTRNPYTVNSAFRPPIFREEDLRPLSRLRRPYTYGITNPGVRDSFVNAGLEQAVDKQPIQSAISVVKLGTTYPYMIQPTATYGIAFPIEVDGKYAIKEEVLSAPISSAYSSGFLNNDTAKDIQENMKYKVIKDDALAYAFNTPMSSRKDIIDNRNIINNKEELLYSATTNPGQNIETHPNLNIDLKSIKDESLLSGLSSNVNALENVDYNGDLSGMKLQDRMNLPTFTTPHSDKKVLNYNPQYDLKKNSPLEFYNTSISGDKKIVNHKNNVITHSKVIPLPHNTNPKINYENPSDELRIMNRKVKDKRSYGAFENGGSINTGGFNNKNAKLKERKMKR